MRPVGMNLRRGMAAALTAVALAGCTKKPEIVIEPNAYPVNYRKEIVEFLRQSLTDRAAYRGAMIAQPMLRPIGDSQHYMVCLQFNVRGQVQTKVAIYLQTRLSQFLDATPEQCSGVAYEPFKELAGATPPT